MRGLPGVVALMITLGCGGGGAIDAGPPDGGTAAGPDIGGLEDAGLEDAAIDAGAGPDAGVFAPADVRFVGRFDDTEPDAVRFSWPGSGFVVRFRGTAARATIRGGRFFTVVLDGLVQPEPLAVTETDATYVLAEGLADAEHTIGVYRRPEGLFGTTVVGGVEVDGEPLGVPVPTRAMEVVGDSWSTGHGVEGPNENCPFSAETENHYLTWGAIAARDVGAELSTVAYIGKGVVRDGGGNEGDQMLALYDRVIADEASSGGTIRPVDVVVVNLGANDFIDGALPAEFEAGYASLLSLVRARHPAALIACVWPRLGDATETTLLRDSIDAGIALRLADGDDRVVGIDIELDELADFGCEFHPGRETHARMGENTIRVLRSELGW